MNGETVIKNMIEEKLLDMSTAYIAKVLSCTETTAKIQPLTMVKQYGKAAKAASVLSDVPVISSARYKFKIDTGGVKRFTVTKVEENHLKSDNAPDSFTIKPLKEGDIVVCLCCDRDISQTKNGTMATPQIGHHSQSDSIVIGIL